MLGAYSAQWKEADEEFSGFVTSVKSQVEEKAAKTYATFELHSFKTQVVAGLNMVARIKVDGEKYIQVKLFRPLPHTGNPTEIHEVVEDVTI
mmetsp:Transcript_64668/g.74281  ORF Transcript_64668/g.74281 Transcript_64668/m.74281 type:complete len:92 (-) Transcript_64668:151-426(-)